MEHSPGRVARIRELWPILLIALGVALAVTVVGAVFNHYRGVSADTGVGTVVTAAAGPDGTQVISVPEWGVRLTAPLAAEMPALRYTTGTGDSIGLSALDLEKVGPACSAAHSALGNLVRFPGGGYFKSTHRDPTVHYVTTINGADYAYQTPLSSCTDSSVATGIINRESAVMFAAVENLEAIPVQ